MNSDNLNWTIEDYERNPNECNNILSSAENQEKIPLLNAIPLHHFKNGQLVRFRGMVQDMLNPEFYYFQYSVRNKESGDIINKPGKFRDLTYCKDNEELLLEHENSLPKERLVYFCIPLPGMNAWAQSATTQQGSSSNKPGTSGCSSGVKRGADDVDMETNQMDTSEQSSIKKKSMESSIKEGNQISYDNNKYFPVPGETGLPCIVKIYEDEDKCDVKLNDRIEVIGYLNLDPALEATWADSDAEDKAVHPPPSLAPRIHSVLIHKLKHSNPLLKQEFLYDEILAQAEKTRSDLHLVLTQLLYGDTIAADYVICHLLSRIYFRNMLPLGKFSLNLSNIISNTYAERLYDILQSLVTNSQYIPLSIEFLNEKSFIPKKDYETNRLWSGRLQLCDDTHLFLDETKMNPGMLNQVGCLNIAALQKLITEQEMRYDFGYYPVPYDTNIPVLILSEGKSLLEADIRLRLKPDLSMASTMDESFDAAKFYLNKELSQRIRIYLTAMRLQKFDMTEEMMKKIGEDYVSMRQQDSRVTSCDLHTLLVLSRLLALSYGRTVLSPEDWSRAVDMETERKLRLA